MDDDRQWFKKLQGGDRDAWDEAFRELYPCAFSAARHPLAALDTAEAEDVAIETLEAIVAKVQDLGTKNELKALCVTMASRAAISRHRKLSALKRGGGQTESLQETMPNGEPRPEPADPKTRQLAGAELHELQRVLTGALSELDPVSSTLIRQHLMDGTGYQELAEQHGVPLGTVGVKLSRGLKKIREKLSLSPLLMKELQEYLR